jgi:hypothetical protein
LTQPRTWPQARDYQDAIQTPTVCFSDSRLKAADIHLDILQMPRVAAGKSAVVFKATSEGKDIAIRCFTRAASDQRLRYRALHEYLDSAVPSYMVGFGYRDREILVGNTRYPLVEMDWVDGDPLDVWVGRHLQQSSDLADQAASWLTVADDMLARQLAHGDIANDNCMVSGSQLKLVDYDGCYIPGLEDKNPGESGAQHFQHPARGRYYAGNMDAFPALVIYLSLLALQADPSLWTFHTDKNLIFHAADYKAPRQTPIWRELAKSPDARVVTFTDTLARMCQEPIGLLPSLLEVTADEPVWWQQADLYLTDNKTRAVLRRTEESATPAPSLEWLLDYLPDQPASQPGPVWDAPVVTPEPPEPLELEPAWPGPAAWPVRPANPEATRPLPVQRQAPGPAVRTPARTPARRPAARLARRFITTVVMIVILIAIIHALVH